MSELSEFIRARVAECATMPPVEREVKRAIVTLHTGLHVCPSGNGVGYTDYDDGDADSGMQPCPTLQLLAVPYRDHPDYPPERPDAPAARVRVITPDGVVRLFGEPETHELPAGSRIVAPPCGECDQDSCTHERTAQIVGEEPLPPERWTLSMRYTPADQDGIDAATRELWTRPNASSGPHRALRRRGVTFRGADDGA